MNTIRRRSFVQWLAASGIGAALYPELLGCGSDDTTVVPAPLGGPREGRTIHFDLSNSQPGVEHELILGTKRIILQPHTELTRNAHREQMPLLGAIPDEVMTHFAEVEVPSDAVQTFTVRHRHTDPNRLPLISMMGICIPQRAVTRAAVQFKARRFNLVPQDGETADGGFLDVTNLADFVDMTDAALNIVFHHPELLSLDVDVAAQVVAHIQSTRAFSDLVHSLARQGRAQSIDGWNEGYMGWANAQHILDSDGQPILDENSQPRWAWTYTDETKNAMRPVIQQALQLVRDDQTLEGSRYDTLIGFHAIEATTVSLASGQLTFRNGEIPESPYSYKLDHEDWKSGRKISITNTEDRTIGFTVENSYFRHLGIYCRFVDDEDKPIPLSQIPSSQRPPAHILDTSDAVFMGAMEARARLMGIPIESEVEEEYEITLPDAARKLQILCGGLGMGSLSSSHDTYGAVERPGAILTGVIDLGIPAVFLAMGIGANKLIESEPKKLIAELGIFLLEFAGTAIANAAFEGSGYPHDTMWGKWGIEILNALIKAAPGEFIGLLAWAAEESEEEAMAHSVPIYGQIWLAAEVTATLVEIGETVVDIFLSPWVIPAAVSSSMNIDVTILHDENDYQFPATAVRYEVIATFSKADTRTVNGTLSNTKVQSIDAQFLGVPAGGLVEITATFYAANDWVAGRGSIKLANVVTPGKTALEVSLRITENKVPLTTDTIYHHRQLLTMQAGAHVWQETAQAPTEMVNSLDCTSVTSSICEPTFITINMTGRLGYGWRGVSPTLPDCGTGQTSNQLYTLQNIALDSPNPDDGLKILQCGFNVPVFMAYNMLGPSAGEHFIIAPAVDPATGQSDYHARKVVLDGTTPFDISQLKSWGRFSFKRIRQVAIHPTGVILVLHDDLDKIELLRLPDGPYDSDSDALFATQVGGRGANRGLMHGAKAMAISLDGQSFLVLEEVNRRIQAFNVNGVLVPYFAGGKTHTDLSLRPEDSGKQITYTDIAMESQGYIYVLSYEDGGLTADSYRLDILNADGTFLSRTRGVVAAKMIVDVWRVVYTLNYQMITGPNQRPEPSVSEWIPSTPAPSVSHTYR